MIESCKKYFHGFKINYKGFNPLLQVSSLQGFKHKTQNKTQGEKCQNAYFETLFNPKVESLKDVLYLRRNPAKTLYSVSPTHFQRYNTFCRRLESLLRVSRSFIQTFKIISQS